MKRIGEWLAIGTMLVCVLAFVGFVYWVGTIQGTHTGVSTYKASCERLTWEDNSDTWLECHE